MGTIFVDNIKQQSSQGSGTITIGASGETVSFASGVTGTNYPAFEVISDSNQTVTDNTYTKVSLQTELLDTNNNFDNSSNYRFTPTVAGKYYIEGQVTGGADGNDRLRNVYAAIYKNGSFYRESRINFHGADITLSAIQVSGIVDMNGSSDYVELFGAVDTTTGTVQFREGTKSTYFIGYRLGT